MAITITPSLSGGRTYTPVSVGQQVTFSASGGTSPYFWSTDTGIINSSTGLFTAIELGTGTITVTDSAGSPGTATRTVIVGSQTQSCVAIEVVEEFNPDVDPCCEYNIDCGKTVQLRVPSFYVRENGKRVAVTYSNVSGGVVGDYSSFRASAADASATANEVSFSLNEALFEIVTNYDMAQTGSGDFTVGWADNAGNTYAVVWTTDTTRFVSVQVNGVEEDAFPVQIGDLVSFGMKDGELVLYINNNLTLTSESVINGCGNYNLYVAIETSAKTVGGYLTNLSWGIVTPGSADEVGTVDGNGVYSSPDNPITGTVQIDGTVGASVFHVFVKNIKPSLRYTHPNPFLAAAKATVWVALHESGATLPALASDGSPDANSGSWIELGTLEASATFAEDIQTQDFDDDEGTYFTSVTMEKASLKGAFTQVRDFSKLARLMQHGTLYPLEKGIRKIGVGGKDCGRCELRVLLVAEPQSIENGFDVIYMSRVQNRGNLTFDIGKKTNTKYEFDFNVLLDRSLPKGSQLYTMAQIEACNSSLACACN